MHIISYSHHHHHHHHHLHHHHHHHQRHCHYHHHHHNHPRFTNFLLVVDSEFEQHSTSKKIPEISSTKKTPTNFVIWIDDDKNLFQAVWSEGAKHDERYGRGRICCNPTLRDSDNRCFILIIINLNFVSNLKIVYCTAISIVNDHHIQLPLLSS